MPRYKLTIEYAGTKYSGWQKQKNARTVQGELERAIGAATRDKAFEFMGSGRTDAGVHALRQVAHLDLRKPLPAETLLRLEARVDSALLWALVLDRLHRGRAPAEALTDVIGMLRAAGVSGRFNFLLTDGRVIAATAAGDTLSYRRRDDAVLVVSEPGDDGPGWNDVPDDSVVTATPQQISVTGLADASPRDGTSPNGRIAIS